MESEGTQGRLSGIMSKKIWRVLACSVRMLRTENPGGNWVTQVYLEMTVCVSNDADTESSTVKECASYLWKSISQLRMYTE